MNLKSRNINSFIAVAILLVAALWCVPLSALDVNSTKFSTSNGLSDNTVRKIFQDSRGYIWFATFNGLSRYDGYNIVKYSPLDAGGTPEFQIRDIIEDSKGFLWILGNNDIINCLNPISGDYVQFHPDNCKQRKYRHFTELSDGSIWLWGEDGILHIVHSNDGLKSTCIDMDSGKLRSNNILTVCATENGIPLLSTDKGLYSYRNGKLTLIDPIREYQWIQPTTNATLMVATNGEVVRLDAGGKLQTVYTIPGVSSRTHLKGAFVDDGYWLISSPTGGYKVNMTDYKISQLRKDLQIPFGKVIVDSFGDLWFHNESGTLYYLDNAKDVLKPLHLIPAEKMKLIDMERYTISRDKLGRAWITTGGNGLYVYEPDKDKLEHFSTQGNNYQLLPTDYLLSSMVDRQNNVWIGTENGGAVMLETNNEGVAPLCFHGKEGIDESVRMIKRLPDNTILISARDGNLYKFSSDLSQQSVIQRGAVIYDLAVDKNGNIWEANKGQGLFLNGKPVSESLIETSSKEIFSLLSDKKGRLWVGTFGAGVDVFTPSADGKTYSHFNFLNKDYGQRRVRSLFEDSNGYIWIATNTGAYRMNSDSIGNKGYVGKLFNLENNSLRSNEVHCFVEDRKGRIWIGEANNGISILDFSSGNDPIITHLGTENGMSHNNILSFVKEGNDYIWATTLYGVSRVNVKTLGVESYAFLSAPTANVHTANSALMLNDGRLLLGTNNGAYTVDLKSIKTEDTNIPIAITQFFVNNEKARFVPGQDGISKDGDAYIVTLPYDKNNLIFDFSTFDYGSPKLTQFRYKLEPLDREWSQATPDNRVVLRNLRPDNYTLIVEAAGADGLWNQKVICKIRIESPWWATWWARMFYILLILAGAYLVMRVISRINGLRNQMKIEEKLTDYKLEFFTNISHEFRTPLTLIQVSLEKLHEKLSALKECNPTIPLSGLNMPLVTLDKNSRRMSRLIDELLTFRKVEKNKQVLYPEPTDVISFLNEIFDNFKDEAISKHLEFKFTANCEEFVMNVDRNALDKIANNLISNALKYTRECGTVTVNVNADTSAKKLIFQVIDNGIGIPDDKKQQLFSRFMHSAMSRNSIGVGLHLTFGLVELHKGTIQHNDNEGGGSIFTVELPTDLQASDNIPQEGIGRPYFETIFSEYTTKDESAIFESTAFNRSEMKRMLIIDDDADIRSFLSNEFSHYFVILTASDGKTGLETARSNDIHIIICDVMMPDMSGFEVTRLLKEDFATSHIPIIQLTALTNDDCQIEGITSGADAYVTKPFNLKFLKTRVAKLIEQRENLFAKFSANPVLTKPQLPMGDRDKEFADRLAEVAEKQLDNSAYSVDDFAADMAMGRTIFFRKVKGVTGYAPKEYLRIMRMKKAAEMLLSTNLSITEVAYRVGISDPAYFNKCFKAQFGKAPSIYQKENTSKPGDSEIISDSTAE